MWLASSGITGAVGITTQKSLRRFPVKDVDADVDLVSG